MKKRVGLIVKIVVVLYLLACLAGSVLAQEEGELTAQRRVFAGIGPGLRTVKRGGDGRLYILASPSPGLVVFDAAGKQVVSIAELAPGSTTSKGDRALITFGEDCEAEPIAERADLNRYLNIGEMATDGQGHLYYAFAYLPEPTVRQFDRLGYARQDIQYTALDAWPAAQATRKEIERQERRGDPPSLKRILTAVGVDRSNGEVWIALNNTLLRFDKDGNRRASYKIYTPQGARLEANTILVEPDRLLIGEDPLGIYEFSRPAKKSQ